MEEFTKDTRHHRRFDVEAMDIRGLVMFSGNVVINDISITGIAIKTDRKITPGQRYTVQIFSRDRDISLGCSVIWSMEKKTLGPPDENSCIEYVSGLQFGEQSQETMTNLMKFITYHRVEKITPMRAHQMSGRRANIRFRLGDAEETTLRLSEPFKARILSLGGMLMAEDRPYAVGSELQMEMTLPGNIRLPFAGMVISCAPAEDRPGGYYDIGIKFSALSDETRSKLKDFIRWLYLKDAGFTE